MRDNDGIWTIIGIAIVLLGTYGWVENIVKLCDYNHFSGMLIARGIGIFFVPLGVVLGYV